MSLRGLVGRTALSDVAKYIASENGVIAKATQVAQDLNALALDQPLSADLASIDNSQESPQDARLRLEFALGERLSLDFSYRDVARQPRIIPLLEEDNVVRHYEIRKLQSGHNGIVGNILIPAPSNETTRIYINFRGTQPHVMSSVHLNFEHCAGEESFYTHANKIMRQINDLIGQVSGKEKRPVQLIFSGHSLGGALSQHAHYAAMVQSALVIGVEQQKVTKGVTKLRTYLSGQYKLSHQFEILRNFAEVDALVLNSWGMAGVSNTIGNSSNVFANLLQSSNKKIKGRFGYNTLDVVPRCGESNTLLDCNGDVACVVISDENANMTRTLVSGCIDGVVAGSVFGGVYGAAVGVTTAVVKSLTPISAAHNTLHYGPFGELLANKEYKTLQNTTPEGKRAIVDTFDNKLTVLQKPLLVKAKSALLKVGDMGAELKESAANGIVSGLKAIYQRVPSLKK